MIDDYVVFTVVVVVVVLVFFIDVAAAEFDVVISADSVVVAFHLLVVFVLFEVATVASDFENGNSSFALAWYFLEIFSDYFSDLMMLLNLLFVGYL